MLVGWWLATTSPRIKYICIFPAFTNAWEQRQWTGETSERSRWAAARSIALAQLPSLEGAPQKPQSNSIHKETETKEIVFLKQFQNREELPKYEVYCLNSSLKTPCLGSSESGVIKMPVVLTCVGKTQDLLKQERKIFMYEKIVLCECWKDLCFEQAATMFSMWYENIRVFPVWILEFRSQRQTNFRKVIVLSWSWAWETHGELSPERADGTRLRDWAAA